VRFEWDPAKAASNLRKHGVSFEEARTLFTGGAMYAEIYDELHDGDEDRFIAIGPVRRGTITVVFVERQEDTIRILGARPATRSERALFEAFLRGKQP
jgi:hypothetical protein